MKRVGRGAAAEGGEPPFWEDTTRLSSTVAKLQVEPKTLEHALFATSSGSTPFADALFEEEEEEGPRAPAAVSSTPRRSPRLLSSAVL